jgi:hypothetical protein
MIHDETKKYEWDAIEFAHREKSTDWYWGLGIAIVTGCILSIIAHNYLLALLLVVGGALLGFYANDRPHPVHVELSQRGIKMGKDLYTYETLKSFWMYQDQQNQNKLIIVTGRPVMPQRIVTLPAEISPMELRNYLLKGLTEKETKPSIIDTLADAIGV